MMISCFSLVSWGWVRLSPFDASTINWPLVAIPDDNDDGDDDEECAAVSGMRIGRGNRSAMRKLAPVTLCSPQIERDFTWDRTRAAAV
jgi:hypothetical protein